MEASCARLRPSGVSVRHLKAVINAAISTHPHHIWHCSKIITGNRLPEFRDHNFQFTTFTSD